MLERKTGRWRRMLALFTLCLLRMCRIFLSLIGIVVSVIALPLTEIPLNSSDNNTVSVTANTTTTILNNSTLAPNTSNATAAVNGSSRPLQVTLIQLDQPHHSSVYREKLVDEMHEKIADLRSERERLMDAFTDADDAKCFYASYACDLLSLLDRAADDMEEIITEYNVRSKDLKKLKKIACAVLDSVRDIDDPANASPDLNTREIRYRINGIYRKYKHYEY